MYKKANEVLTDNSSDNYFFDDEFIYVRELLNKFTEDDWKSLIQELKSKDDKYKIRLAYCIDEDAAMNGFNLLLDLINENDEVVEYALDSLRSFDKEPYKNLIY
ncbi:hypothetical protein [Listeria cossartiae]|nr:hypothetical protein [Listeria cossartiae]